MHLEDSEISIGYTGNNDRYGEENERDGENKDVLFGFIIFVVGISFFWPVLCLMFQYRNSRVKALRWLAILSIAIVVIHGGFLVFTLLGGIGGGLVSLGVWGNDIGILYFKLIVLFLILFVSVVSVMLPYVIQMIYKDGTRVSVGMTFLKGLMAVLEVSQGFASGVLLVGGLVHLVPDSAEDIRDAFDDLKVKNEAVIDFPWANVLAVFSFSFLVFVDYFVSKALLFLHRSKEKIETIENYNIVNYKPYGDDENEDSLHDHGIGQAVSGMKSSSLLQKLGTGVVLWFSLFTHSFIAGLGLGVEKKKSHLWTLLFAILSHKAFAAYTLGIVLAKGIGKTKWYTKIFIFLLLITFCIATPSGIGIGMIVSSVDSPIYDLISSLLMSMAGGAFVFVALYELLFEYLSETKTSLKASKLLKSTLYIVLYVIGATLMSVLAIWA